jgi:hypothetical protein
MVFCFVQNFFLGQTWLHILTNKKKLTLCKQVHAHQKVSRFLGPRYIGDDFFLGPNLVLFNRAVVPYEISC